MRWLLLFLLLILSVGLSACSYSSDFVVVNSTSYPIQVIYKVKAFTTGPQTLDVDLRVMSASDLEIGERSKWTKLNPNQYKIDEPNRTVTLTLHARDALLITSMHNYVESRNSGANFPIEEIAIVGKAGEMKFTGDKARQAFQNVSRSLYTLTYK